MFVIGSQADVVLALDALKQSFSAIGLHISEDLKVSSYGTTILGVPVGHVEYVAKNCLDFAKLGQTLCYQVLSLEDVQSEDLLLRYSHITRRNHLVRSVNPEHVRSAVQAHDSLTKSTFIRFSSVP